MDSIILRLLRIIASISICYIILSFPLHSQTGIHIPSMSSCDTEVISFLNTYSIPGASIAISKDGKLIYNRAFGNANIVATENTNPYHLFRIASISKPITSVAIFKLKEAGLINMNDKVFGTGGILQNHPFLSTANITDSRIYDITVQNLLEHSAGWDRNNNCFPNPTTPYSYFRTGCDPISVPLHVSQVNNTSNPTTDEDMLFFLLEKGLDFAPNTAYAYSNMGYVALGEIIEEISGLTYEDYVKTQVLEPIGACDFHLGKNLIANKLEREVEYIGNGYTTLDCYGNGTMVPWEYSGFNLEAMDAHGGWVGTTRDMLRLITAVDGFSTRPDILTASSITNMTSPSSNNPFYAKGWSVNSYNNWWHDGALDGTATIAIRSSGGYTMAVFLNKRVIGSNYGTFISDLDNLPWYCINSATSFPTFDLFETPTLNTKNIEAFYTSSSTAQLNFQAGDGDKRIVIARQNNPVDKFPVDGTNYIANSVFGSGTHLGNGNFVVYNGTGHSITLSNLSLGTNYHFRSFEYNENAATGYNELYLLAKSELYSYFHEGSGTCSGRVDCQFNSSGLDLTPFSILSVPSSCSGTMCTDVYLVGDISGVPYETTNIIGEDGTSIIGQTSNSAADCDPNGASSHICFTSAQYASWSTDGNITLYLSPNAAIDDICTDSYVNACVTTCTTSSNYSCVNSSTITSCGTYTTTGPDRGNGTSQPDADHSVWYKFIPQSTGTINIYSCNSGVDTRLWIYEGSCTSLNQIGSSDDNCALAPGGSIFWASEIIGLAVTAGIPIYIEWDNRWSTDGFDFTIDCSSGCPPNYAGANQLTGTQTTVADYETNGAIESNQVINADVDYDSGTMIDLLQGFEVKLGKLFHAFIDGCGNLINDENDSSN